MAIPKYNELYDPFLTAISDGKIHTAKEVASTVANILQLSPEDLAEQLPSQRQTTFANRLNWAKTYLKKAGLVDSPKPVSYTHLRAHFFTVTSPSQTNFWRAIIHLSLRS